MHPSLGQTHQTNAFPPVDATAVLVDLRNFTPNLKASRVDDDGVRSFCHFLGQCYSLCGEAALLAMDTREMDDRLFLSSTGDGVLMVFHSDEWHFGQAYLTGLVLSLTLPATCSQYNADFGNDRVPATSFGIGIESGRVSRVVGRRRRDEASEAFVETVIGDCINVAARAESVTKNFARTRTILGPRVNNYLCQELLQKDYDGLIEAAWSHSLDDGLRYQFHDAMNELNRKLCLAFIDHLHLKGVDRPVALFRVQDVRLRLDNPEFMKLLDQLTKGDQAHLDRILGFVQG